MALGEIDFLAEDSKRNRFVVVEVRGRTAATYRPSLTISKVKVNRLKTLASQLQRRLPKSVHIELVEVVLKDGKPEIKEFAIL